MRHTVYIRNNETGEIRGYRPDYDWDDEFCWEEGNFACDCNRALFFHNHKEPDCECECGETKFTITSIVLDNGQEVYTEREGR